MIPGSINALLLGEEAGGAAAYSISRSLRFNSSDSAYLSRTPASAGNRKKWTWAAWVKRSGLGTDQVLLDCRPVTSDSQFTIFYLKSTNTLEFSGPVTTWRTTTQLFRDTSAWYHILIALDTTQATAADRIKIYVNGSQVTDFATSANPSQNADLGINQAALHGIGASSGGSPAAFLNGYLADVHFIDGQALTPSSFTEVSATTGQLIPKAYTGSFGTNGFWLKFSDNSAATATTLGKDYSGNNNNWTPNNLSVTAGAGNDSLVDTPTSYGTDTGAGGEVRGNYCTLNPLVKASTTTLSNGNLDAAYSGWQSSFGTIAYPKTGKWYYEFSPGNALDGLPGIADVTANLAVATGTYYTGVVLSYAYYGLNGQTSLGPSNTQTAYGATFGSGDIVGVAFDADAGTLVFYKNGVSQGTAFSGLTGAYIPAIGQVGGTAVVNFGQRPFAYTAPSGFKALCDTNLPAPVVAKPSTVMDVVLWSGDGTSNRSITLPGGFSPDFVWTKMRNAANQHLLYDAVRGATLALATDNTNAETTRSTTITSFDSSGFTTGSSADTNGSGNTYVGWCWDAGSSTVTNTQGSITSSVRANTSAGFSVITYTGNLSGAGVSTVGHGLGVAPSMVITKRRNGASNWCVQHISTSTASQILFLDTTDAQFNTSSNGSLSRPTSTVFSVNNSTGLGVNGQTHVAYAFAPVAGYSSGFSYTGNGSTDGSFVYLGFRPRLILLKCSSTTGNWTLLDTAREGYNVDNDPLYPNLSNAEGTTDLLDITSNGFKLRTTDASVNSSGATYVGYAWAEAPFAYSRAR